MRQRQLPSVVAVEVLFRCVEIVDRNQLLPMQTQTLMSESGRMLGPLRSEVFADGVETGHYRCSHTSFLSLSEHIQSGSCSPHASVLSMGVTALLQRLGAR
jgi:hypothetical protein